MSFTWCERSDLVKQLTKFFSSRKFISATLVSRILKMLPIMTPLTPSGIEKRLFFLIGLSEFATGIISSSDCSWSSSQKPNRAWRKSTKSSWGSSLAYCWSHNLNAASSLRRSWVRSLFVVFRSRSPEFPRQPSPHPITEMKFSLQMYRSNSYVKKRLGFKECL